MKHSYFSFRKSFLYEVYYAAPSIQNKTNNKNVKIANKKIKRIKVMLNKKQIVLKHP
jgi:hypothetical protein